MPSALSDKFLRYYQQSAKTQYHSIKVGAIYCLLSPESYYYRPKEFHSKLEKSMKVGKATMFAAVSTNICFTTLLCIPQWRIACYSSNILLPKQKERILIIVKRLSLQR